MNKYGDIDPIFKENCLRALSLFEIKIKNDINFNANKAAIEQAKLDAEKNVFRYSL